MNLRKNILIIVFLVLTFSFFPNKVFAVWYSTPNVATLLVGEVTDHNSSLYGSCTDGRKVIGGTCPNNSSCVGLPSYTVTWSQTVNGSTDGASADSLNCNPSRNNDPYYTFELGNTPQGNESGIPTTISIKVNDTSFKLTSWFYRLSDDKGNSCAPIQQGTFANPSNEETIQINAIRTPACHWSHVWFDKGQVTSGGSSLISANVKLTTSGVDQNKVIAGTPLNFSVNIPTTNVPGGLASTRLFWSRADKNSSECAGAKSTDSNGDVYCDMNATPSDLSTSSSSGPDHGDFTASFTPTIPGIYYIGPFITSHSSEANGSARISCSGNAFCKWGSSSSCLADPTGTNCLSSAVCSGSAGNISSCGDASVLILNVVSSSPTVTTTQAPTVTTTAPTLTTTQAPIPTYTTDYRCSDTSFDANDSGSTSPQWTVYENKDFSGPPITFDYTFTHNVMPGADLTLFCQFRDNKGNKSAVVSKSIKYVGGEPKITSASCTFSPLGSGTLVTVRGVNFGQHSNQGTGNIRVEGKEATISSWVSLGALQSSSSSASAVTTNNDTGYEIKSTLTDKLSDGRHQIVLTTDDGRIVNGYCALGLSTVDFTLKTACLTESGNLAEDNVAVDIKEKIEGAKSLLTKKIKIDKDGKPVDFTPGIEIAKTYVLSIRAPKTVSRNVEFVAEAGTTNLNDIILPVGDIYPVSSPDNKINAFDKGEMSREWAINTDVARPGDLNNDSRVNSVDYSCLQINYNKSGD